MSTDDQKLSSAMTGEALRAAHRSELQPIVDQLAEVCQGRDDLRIEAAGELAGAWFANPAAAPRWGYELIAAGMLLVGGIHDGDRLKQAVLEGWERRLGSLRGYGPAPLGPRTTHTSFPGGGWGLSSRGRDQASRDC